MGRTDPCVCEFPGHRQIEKVRLSLVYTHSPIALLLAERQFRQALIGRTQPGAGIVRAACNLAVPDEQLSRQLADQPLHLQAEQRDGNGRSRQTASADDVIHWQFIVAEHVVNLLFIFR